LNRRSLTVQTPLIFGLRLGLRFPTDRHAPSIFQSEAEV